MEVIVPAAGLSTRFPGDKPKYMLYDYAGKSMLYSAIEPYLGKHKIHVGILAEHEAKFSVSDFIRHEFGKEVNLVILPNRTLGPADTVDKIIDIVDIHNPIFIKDCDSVFDHEIVEGNYVCVAKIQDKTTITNPANKSYVIVNDTGFIQKIVEKDVVSDTYCVGGYKFQAAHLYTTAMALAKRNNINHSGEIFVSQVVKYMLTESTPFFTVRVNNYIDVGTMKDWMDYNNKPVIFCDIDGTIICNQQRYGVNNYHSSPIPLINNIQTMLKMQDNGSQIIFTTARPEEVRQVTLQMLGSLGFKNFQLLMNLNNSARILINDYNEMNPYPRATAVNIKRNSDNLSDFINTNIMKKDITQLATTSEVNTSVTFIQRLKEAVRKRDQ
jgi:choline kinase